MEGVYTLEDDLGDLMKSFLHWKEIDNFAYHTFLETNKSNREMHGVIEVLREELRIARDLERTERYRDASNCDVLSKQQTLIDELIGVKDENLRMSSHIMDLEKSYSDLKSLIEAERNDHFQELESISSSHSFELKQLKMKAEHDVNSIKTELEEKCSEFHQRYQEIAKKLEALEAEKNEEVNLVIAEYEEKLHKCNEELTAAKLESKHIQDRAAANISIYQKKLMESEKDQRDSNLKVISNKINSSNNQEGHMAIIKNLATKLIPSKSVLSECNKDFHMGNNTKGRFRNISKCLPQRNHGQEISPSLTELEFIEMQNEESKDLSTSMGRKSVAFPVIKKKKLFTPTEQNFLNQ